MAEPKKFSFGFSKVAKKPTLFAPKPVETVEYIKCVEDKTVKLVHEEVVKPKELPIIPMPPGSSVRDRILEAVKAREAKAGFSKSSSSFDEPKDKNGVESKTEKQSDADSTPAVQNGVDIKPDEQVEANPLTLDEMAAKELLENARMETEEKKETPVIVAEEGANRQQSTIDDYENMPINDFGLAMLRGMGWDPKKGIGLNEKVVTPAAPQLRPKGMGLGADKALVAQTQPGKAAAEEMVMKNGSMVKVIHGPHSQLYGKVEGFEELPGRILVRLTLSNTVVSLSEFMVQLVGPTEYNKNSKVMNLDKYNAALEPETDRKPIRRDIKAEPRETYSKPMKPSDERRSRSPVHDEKSSGRSKSKKKKDRARDRTSPKRSKKRDSSESDSSDDKQRKRRSPERRRHKSSKKSKYQSSGSSDDSDHRRSKKSDKSLKHSKHKSYRSDSESSPERHRKKHRKSRK